MSRVRHIATRRHPGIVDAMGLIGRKQAAPPVEARSRRGVPEDIERLYQIVAAVRENRQFETAASFDAAVHPFLKAGLCWVLSIGPAIVGFVAVDARAGSVEMLYVHPAHEGKTIGRALMRRALGDLIRLGHRIAWLVTARETRAERFYRAQGWVEMAEAGRGSVKLAKKLSGM
ncbi:MULTISPECIES: GNAT family N-acetyltransferase [Thalassobaculum]|mgnify:CR=1 FL=1|uniref:Acetyltransferase (GNAT) domain-containing protein n=1 Tax=Thalassobaculum litoreum DSM 18839 TaxID=1123362 RepID=A0A8G2F1X2_9PROT|nr:MULTISPECIES: GNAT family N-acetyltransferase [Thalassobaculum]SDF30086.1 Acetyltransferase (GNAT) domain-containing protein [Thalassobaculum litoreum DSM 18839]